MKIGIHLQGNTASSQNSPFERKFLDILTYNKIDFSILNINDFDFWEKLKDINIFIYRFGGLSSELQLANTIMPIIENQLGIKCFPNQDTCWHFDDKIKQSYLFKVKKYPIIDSWVFWDKTKCINWLDTIQYPIVFKLKGGAGSTSVVLLESKREAVKVVNKIFTSGIKSQRIPSKNSLRIKNFSIGGRAMELIKIVGKRVKKLQPNRYWFPNIDYAYFQKYLPGNTYDTRVLIIGNRALAYRRINRVNDFRSSGSGNFDVTPEKIDLKHIEIAFKISSQMGFQSMAYDFIYDENGNSKICEISYTYVDWMIQTCKGYWDINLKWHEGHFWPQYFILMDLLELPNLKQPELKQEDYLFKSNVEKFKIAFLNKPKNKIN
jgi:glutathione synthase/RimK-type ligase-like ATP-grasp enzyme